MSETIALKFHYRSLRVEYEGPVSFVEDHLVDFCERIVGLDVSDSLMPDSDSSVSGSTETTATAAVSQDLAGIAMNALAAKFGISKGADLFKAAAIHMALVQGREIFQKSDLLEEAKKANHYYKDSTHRKNSGSIVAGLLKEDFLREQGGENVSLSAEAISSAKAKLGVN